VSVAPPHGVAAVRGLIAGKVPMASPAMPVIDDKPMLEVLRCTHFYGATPALDDVSLGARRGEFLTILGESGSGKTTMLRIISGLERPTRIERLAIDGEDVSGRPAAMRNCTTVFQNYALFPHMSVGENVGYGLKVRGVPREAARRQALDALALVRMGDKETRRIHQLSGGERQRVALARALVTRPAILLLDEPLGALDEKLRFEMQSELVDLHRSLGMTFVYITHSQEEALTMSDRVILMRKGRIEQSGTPETLFDRPVSRFAAEFMGFENVLPAVVETVAEGRVVARVGGEAISGLWTGPAAAEPGAAALVAIRAERLSPASRTRPGARENSLPATPGERTYRGKYVDQSADTPVGPLKVRIWDRTVHTDDFDAVAWSAGDCVVLPA
jgi:spermidine/putrescine transport system ATP-binding protein